MSDWAALMKRPSNLPADAEGWFTSIAEQLLNGCVLMVGNQPHRFVEVEFYYHGAGHLDPFTHRDPLQLETGRWYFHRTAGVYRSGSFKGMDLSFGSGGAHGGVLIRGIEAPDGSLVDGPSLCVDHLLEKTGHRQVAALDDAIGGRLAWDSNNVLFLDDAPAAGRRPLFRSARVGLSLKKARASAPGEMPRYIMKLYRYLSEPRRTAKGKTYLALALHGQGKSVDEIYQLTGCTRQAIQRYIEDYEAGRAETDFKSYFGADLSPKDLCRLHGTWAAHSW
jgi:hypothetical protein